MIHIETLKHKYIKENDVSILNNLEHELRDGAFKDLDMFSWQLIIAQKDARVIALREDDKIIGMAILRWHDLPGGRVGTLEDVVLAPEYRQRGYGVKLVDEVIRLAKAHNISFIDLTSNPSREAANNLYQKLGWEKRDTNVYRLYLK